MPSVKQMLGRNKEVKSLLHIQFKSVRLTYQTTVRFLQPITLRHKPMNFELSASDQSIHNAVIDICKKFGDDYWLEKDRHGGFPVEFHQAFADGGWLGICMPEEFGGSGLGVSQAAIMMQAIAE